MVGIFFKKTNRGALSFLLLVIVIIISCSANRDSLTLSSPDGFISVRLQSASNALYYAVQYKAEKILTPSRLGFLFKDAKPLGAELKIVTLKRSHRKARWQPLWGTDKIIHDNYNELRVDLKESRQPFRKLSLIFRAYNDGIAFRYLLPRQDSLSHIRIISEETQFNLAQDDSAWWIPGDYDSYEHLYRHSQASEIDSANTPLTLETPDGTILSIHEAALTDYAGMTLGRIKGHRFKSKLTPWPDGIKVKGQTPLKTPWRVILIAPNAAALLKSHLILNLNKPGKIKEASWIHPMKYVGIWWGMHIGKYSWHSGAKHGATSERAKKYIDFAADHGLRGVLIEGWNVGWDSWLSGNNVQDYTKSYPDFDLQKVVRYARQKGVEIIGHHESGGNVPQYERQLSDALDFYQQLGIHAVKTGYAGKMHPRGQHHHGQWMVRHYRKVVREAARRHIMIDAHEPIKATGICRTWPNFMTREGARGMEYNAWSEGNPPEHTTILPFTRFLAGPMDYTPGIFNIKFDHTGKHRVHTTLAKQLALYVVLYSPLQMAADLIENYEHQPAFKFIEDVPVDWDESQPVAAKIGDYVAIARRQGSDWYVGTITDEHARTVAIPLSFLNRGKTYQAVIYEDGAQTDYDNNPTAIRIRTIMVNASDTLQARMVKSGGQAVQLHALQ